MTLDDWTIVQANNAEDLSSVRGLIESYNRMLDVDLCFQGFEEEMRTFPATYELVLAAKLGPKIVGCVCLKRLDEEACEMKRLFVSPEARGLGIGKALSLALIAAAKERGFRQMKLDTLTRLAPALTLYRELGFEETAAYTPNPEPDVVYLAKLI